jgi:trk system potassium uptake protein TrkH
VSTLPRPGRVRSPSIGVDVRAALGLVGTLVRPLAVPFAVPAALAAGYGEAAWPFLVAGAVTAAVGTALVRLGRGRPPVGGREGFLVVAGVWLAIALVGAIPYLLATSQLTRPVDALFESMSGFSPPARAS